MKLQTYRRVQTEVYTLSKDELKQALIDYLLKEAGVEFKPEQITDITGHRDQWWDSGTLSEMTGLSVNVERQS